MNSTQINLECDKLIELYIGYNYLSELVETLQKFVFANVCLFSHGPREPLNRIYRAIYKHF
jgi:hypothetical protein